VVAHEWERAAIVAAWVVTSDNQAHVTSDMRAAGQVTATKFAALGIHGLYVVRITSTATRQAPRP